MLSAIQFPPTWRHNIDPVSLLYCSCTHTNNTPNPPLLMVLLERCALRLKTDGRRLIRRILFAPDPFVAALRWAWVALIIWGEIGVFFYALSGCRWPRTGTQEKVRLCFFPLLPLPTVALNFRTLQVQQTHVLLVADAQLPNPHALAQVDDWTVSAYAAEVTRTVYVRRAWRAARQMRPHVVLFLGDMLKSGRSVHSDDELRCSPFFCNKLSLTHAFYLRRFTEYVEHFNSFFVDPLGPDVEVRYIPGNADVGCVLTPIFFFLFFLAL